MGLPVVWVWTHDSVGLGEDGPTHQPVEHYAALRAIPNIWLLRPADATETAKAWRVALERRGRPGRARALAPGRAGASTAARSRPPTAFCAAATCCGTRVRDTPGLVLISTGTEVATTLEAAQQLAGEGVGVRVVSMPCMDLFELQTRTTASR